MPPFEGFIENHGFFFSSRRRHTRCGRDWSSDVCSSDLGEESDVWGRDVAASDEVGEDALGLFAAKGLRYVNVDDGARLADATAQRRRGHDVERAAGLHHHRFTIDLELDTVDHRARTPLNTAPAVRPAR